MNAHLFTYGDVTGQRELDSDEDDQGAITPFTETTVNLPDMPMSPETDEEKPTFDHYHQQQTQSRYARHHHDYGITLQEEYSSFHLKFCSTIS